MRCRACGRRFVDGDRVVPVHVWDTERDSVVRTAPVEHVHFRCLAS